MNSRFGTSASVAFSSADSDIAGFQCSLDGGAFAACASPKAFTGLTAGAHTVVFLNVGMAAGLKRVGLSSARPLLAGINPRATYKSLLDARLPVYREVATIEDRELRIGVARA